MTQETKTAAALKRVLGDTYALYLKTHGYHWNVEGPNFKSLHELFELQYTAIWQSLDEIAERIRILGVYAPTGPQLAELATIDAADNDVPSANTMVQNLVAAQAAWLEGAKVALDIADDEDDEGSESLLSDLISAHEKMAWMLRASLER